MSIDSSHLSPAEALVRFEHFAGDVCDDYEGLSLALRSVNRNEMTGASLAQGLHSFVILFRSAVVMRTKGGGNLVGPGLATAVGVIASVTSAFSHLHIPRSPLPQPVHASSHTVSLGLAPSCFTARIRFHLCSGIPSSRTHDHRSRGTPRRRRSLH